MKQLFTLTAALFATTMTMAHDAGRVVSATPVMERVAVPRQVCTMERVQVQRRAPGRVENVQHCTIQTVFEYRPVALQSPQTAHAPLWYGHRRPRVVPYVSTERRGNTWEDDFLDRQMR